MGHDVSVITSLFTFGNNGQGTYFEHPIEYDNPDGVHVFRLDYRKPRKIFSTLRRFEGLFDVISRVEPDIIFSHNLSYADTTVVRKYVKQHPAVYVFADNHADYVNSARNWLSYHVKHAIMWRHYAKVLEPYLAKCYGVTPMRCRFLKEMYRIAPNKVEFLPMGVDDDAIPSNREEVRAIVRNELGISEHDFVVFTGGKIDRLKNTHILISALEQIENTNVHLIICGTLTPQMEYLSSSIDSNSNIHYLGWCDAPRVINCMIASDLACFPGTHSTLWEQAVGVGLPSVFKRWVEMEHVNINGNCVLVEGDDSKELSVILSKIFNSSEILLMKEKAMKASQFFLYSKIAKEAIQFEKTNVS